MKSAENRRARLRQWFSTRSRPEREKSYLSQLMNGKASFGEKAARRLEQNYGMGDKYLDTPANADESGMQDDDIVAIVEMLKKLDCKERSRIRGKIESWIEIIIGNNKIPEDGRYPI